MSQNEAWDRDKLYSEVWTEPVTKVAKRYNVSDVAVAKACRKLRIPLPGRGYWARIAAGQKIKQTALPLLKDLPVVEHIVREPRNAAKPEASPDPERDRIQELKVSGAFASKRSEQSIIRHPLIRITRDAFRGATIDSRGIAMGKSRAGFELRVTKPALPRALHLAARLVEVWESQGLTVTADRDKGTLFHVFDEGVQVRISERVKQERTEIPNPKYSWERWNTTYHPTGELVVKLFSSWPRGEWRDTVHRRLEEAVPDCIAGIMVAGLEMRRNTERLRKEEQERRRKTEEMHALKMQIEEEERKVAALEQEADSLRRTAAIRQYVDAYLMSATIRGDLVNPESVAGRWVIWAREQADRMDPLKPSPPSILDRKSDLRSWY